MKLNYSAKLILLIGCIAIASVGCAMDPGSEADSIADELVGDALAVNVTAPTAGQAVSRGTSLTVVAQFTLTKGERLKTATASIWSRGPGGGATILGPIAMKRASATYTATFAIPGNTKAGSYGLEFAVTTIKNRVTATTTLTGPEFFIRCGSEAGCNPRALWETRWATNGSDADAIAHDPSGNLLAIGTVPHSAVDEETDISVRKYTSDGTLLWEKKYDGVDFYDYGTSIASDRNGNVLAAGRTRNYDMWFAKYDPQGQLLWSKIVASRAGLGPSIAADSQGNVIVGGAVGPSASRNVWVRKYSADGQSELWTKTTSSADSIAYTQVGVAGLAVDSEDNVVAVGSITVQQHSANDFWMAKYQGATGNESWSHIEDSGLEESPTSASDVNLGVAITTDGHIVVLAANGGLTGGSFVTQYTAAGNEEWTTNLRPVQQRFATVYGPSPTTVLADGNNIVVVGSQSEDDLEGYYNEGLWVTKLDSRGIETARTASDVFGTSGDVFSGISATLGYGSTLVVMYGIENHNRNLDVQMTSYLP